MLAVINILTRRESGHVSRRKEFLPANKQYLVTRRVPCRHRPKSLEREALDEEIIMAGNGEEDWVATHTDRKIHGVSNPSSQENTIPDMIMDINDQEEEEEAVKDMEMDEIPGLEDMQMPSDDEDSDTETHRK